jgi:hypothetical protein
MSEVNDNPDMLVAYVLGLDMAALQIKQNPETQMSTLENVPQTALVITLIDPETEFVTWAGVATAEFKDLEPEAAKKRLKYAVTSMFKKLPKNSGRGD